MARKGLIEKKVTITNENGEKVRKSVYGHSRAEIDRKIEKLEKVYVPPFETVANAWYDEHKENIEMYTANCYIAPLKDVCAYFDCSIDEIEPKDIQLFLKKMAAQQFARQTIKLRLIVLRQIFDYAMLKGYVTFNPCLPVKVPKTKPAQKVPAASIEDMSIIVDNVDKDPFGLFAFFLLYTGLRRSELLALCYEDIKGGFIDVNKVVVFDGNEPVIRPYTKSQAGMRRVPVLAPLQPYTKGKGLIFNVDGKPLSRSQLLKGWAGYKKRTGVTCNPHQLRHAFATLCYDAGIDSKQAQYLLGHSKESTTREIYTDLRQNKIDEAVEKLNKFVS